MLAESFVRFFKTHHPLIARAPGNVKLIGEHTDYNGGFVLLMAINRCVRIVARKSSDRLVRRRVNYMRGVVWSLRQKRIDFARADLAIESDVPGGAGLSPCATLEVCVAVTIQLLSGLDLERVDLALVCQRTENEFVGVKSGIMDQFVAALGKEGHALLIDCLYDHEAMLKIKAHSPAYHNAVALVES